MPAAGLAQPTVNTRVVNDASQAVPVHIVTPPAAREVLCRLNVNGGSSAGPFFNLGVTTQQTSVTCPDGVSRVDVKQVAFSPDVGNASALSAASFRMTVGFQQPTGPGGLVCPPAGIVAILTNGSPRATVMQPFQLDTSGAAQTMVCFKAFSTSGIAGHGTDFRGTVFFIGTEVR